MEPITAAEFAGTLTPQVPADTVRAALRRDPHSPDPVEEPDRATGTRYYDPTQLAAWWPNRRRVGKPRGATMETVTLLEQARAVLAPWTEEEVMVWQEDGRVMVREVDGIPIANASALANRLLDAGLRLTCEQFGDAYTLLAAGQTCQIIRRSDTQ